MSAHTEAIAYRIWAYAEPLGWDCTVKEIAEALGVGWRTVANTCRHRNWLQRLRTESPYFTSIIPSEFMPHRTVRRDMSDIIPEWGE